MKLQMKREALAKLNRQANETGPAVLVAASVFVPIDEETEDAVLAVRAH
jgi:hypothetical protein